MSSIYTFLRRALDRIDGAIAAIGCVLLFTLMLVVMADVALRYLANAPLVWSYEVISLFLLPGLFFLSVSHAMARHAHVAVDLAHNHVSVKTRFVFEALASIVATPVFGFIAWVALSETMKQFSQGATPTSGLEIPTWLSTSLLPIGFGLLAFRCLLNAIGYTASLFSSKPWLELPPLSGTQEVEQ